MDSGIDLSIVVPLYNEQDSVVPLCDAINIALNGIPGQKEIILIDDGSKDATFSVAETLAKENPHLRVVKFRRNYGQTPAMAAGIDLARGRYIVTMDGDLQNDPSDIAHFISKLDEGFDLVVGWRYERQDKLITRKIPSKIANWIIGKVTGVPIKDNGCSLKGFRASVIKQVPLYSEMHRFIPAMASMAGPKIAQIKVQHHARKFGESKYGLSRVYKVLFDLLAIKMVAGFAERPIAWFATIASPFLVAASLILIWQLARLMGGQAGSVPIAGAGLLCAALCIFLLFSGGLAEMITRTGGFDVMKARLVTARKVCHEAAQDTDRKSPSDFSK